MKHILVGVDGSPHARKVLEAAVDLARRIGAQVCLYRAVSLPHELPAIALSMAPDEIASLIERLAREEVQQLARDVPPEILAGVRVSLAIPWQGVCEAAHLEKADLIVIGSHGYHGLDRLLGTTAAKIVNHAEMSVLVVR